MAIDSYMMFKPYKQPALDSESQVDLSSSSGIKDDLIEDFKNNKGKVFEVDDFSFDIEQTLNIGSQSQGAGAGKVTFNPFSITRKIDRASPQFFDMACSGTAFEKVSLALRKSGGGDLAGIAFLRFDFKLVAVKTIEWSHDDESPKETVTFEYGSLMIRYHIQNPDGSMGKLVPGGWNRVTNKQDHDFGGVIGS